MSLIDIIFNRFGSALNILFIPAIIISAVLSVLMADIHRELKGSFSWFDRKFGDNWSNFDRICEIIAALIFSMLIVGFLIFVFIIFFSLTENIMSKI